MSQEEQNRRIDYIEFPTSDIEASKRFYSAVFGWTFEDFGSAYVSFNDGRMRGGFQKQPVIRSGGPLVVVYATNLAETQARIQEHGGEIVVEMFEFPGGRRFHFADPGGNVLAVWSDR